MARAILDQLPRESILYIGDTAHSPYGPKPIADVRGYALEMLDTSSTQGVKMLVIACNTASAAMLRDARERYDVPGRRGDPARRAHAVSTTRNGRVGVIGTAGTIGSGAYQDAFAAATDLDAVHRRPARGSSSSSRPASRRAPRCSRSPRSTSRRCATPDVDTLVLGCTHYPFLEGAIQLRDGPGRVASSRATPRPRRTSTGSSCRAT